jgi:Ca2+-transporting ATPase
MLIPGLQGVFKVVTLDMGQLMTVYILAFLNLPIIQFMKKLRRR